MKTWEREIKKIEQGEKTYREGSSKITETELRWALLGVIDTLYELERTSSPPSSFYIKEAIKSLCAAGIYFEEG